MADRIPRSPPAVPARGPEEIERLLRESPLDLRPTLQLQGRLEPSQPATMQARFVLRIVRDRGSSA